MSNQVIRRIPDAVFDSKKFIERQLSNNGGLPTKLLTVDDSIQFIMVLPGQTAKEVRQQFGVIIKRHFAGDQSLHAEIDGNATSSSPIAQLARESLGMPAADSLELVDFKRRREELELLKGINLIESERLAIQRERNEMELKHQKKTHENELKHKDETQKRLRIERKEYIEFERKKQDLNQKKRRREIHPQSNVDPNETESDSNWISTTSVM